MNFIKVYYKKQIMTRQWLLNQNERVKRIIKNNGTLGKYYCLHQPNIGYYKLNHIFTMTDDLVDSSIINLKYLSVDEQSIIKYLLITCNYIGLPIELNPIIANYILTKRYLNLKVRITYPDTYPFNPPHWNLIDVKSNIFKVHNLNEYFEYLLDNHNQQFNNRCNWSAILHIDKNILNFLVMINRFIDYDSSTFAHASNI